MTSVYDTATRRIKTSKVAPGVFIPDEEATLRGLIRLVIYTSARLGLTHQASYTCDSAVARIAGVGAVMAVAKILEVSTIALCYIQYIGTFRLCSLS